MAPVIDPQALFLTLLSLPGSNRRQGRKLLDQLGLEGTGLTVNAELKVLGLLASWAEGHTLILPFVTQMTANNSENLAILLQQDVRIPWKEGPREKPLIRPGCWWRFLGISHGRETPVLPSTECRVAHNTPARLSQASLTPTSRPPHTLH